MDGAAPAFRAAAGPPREAEAAWLADALGSTCTATVLRHQPLAWPQSQPEWLKYATSPKVRAAAQASWTQRLRVLLPDANGAPSAARREALWQRVCASGDMTLLECVPLEQLISTLESVALQSGLVERRPAGHAPPKQCLFMGAALRAAAEEIGAQFIGTGPGRGDDASRIVHRRAFRLLLMRMHQYLDVHAVLADVVTEPHHRVRRDSFERLLRERRHVHSLKPGGEVLTPYMVCGPWERKPLRLAPSAHQGPRFLQARRGRLASSSPVPLECRDQTTPCDAERRSAMPSCRMCARCVSAALRKAFGPR